MKSKLALVLLAFGAIASAQLPESVYLIDSNSVSSGNPQGRRVFRFNADGSLIGSSDNPYLGNFIGPGATSLANTPLIGAPLRVNGVEKLLVSNQGGTIDRYSASGVFEATIVTGLNNPRGISLGPDGLYYVAEGNTNTILKFKGDGTPAGTFATGVVSCWYVGHLRNGDKLISRSTTVSGGATPQVERWSANGVFLGNFITGYAFTQQITEMDNGNILVAVFSPNSGSFAKQDGLYEFTPAGVELRRYESPGTRGVVELSNGNLLSTGGNNVWEFNPGNTVGLLRTGFGGTVGLSGSNFRMLYRHRFYGANITVNLENFDFGTPSNEEVTVQLRHMPTGNIVWTDTLPLNANSVANFKSYFQGTGMYQLYVKGSHWLTKAVPVDLGPTTANVTVSLVNGDVDNDNLISILDYIELSSVFGANSSDSNWNTANGNGVKPSASDLDGDGEVSILDYIVLSANFEAAGDDPTA